MLMRWAEQTSESIMLREVPSLADADKCRMLLRVSQQMLPVTICWPAMTHICGSTELPLHMSVS